MEYQKFHPHLHHKLYCALQTVLTMTPINNQNFKLLVCYQNSKFLTSRKKV